MAYVERTDEEIFAAWDVLIAQDPKKDEKSFAVGGVLCSQAEMLARAKAGERFFYRIFVLMLRDAAQDDECDPLDYLQTK